MKSSVPFRVGVLILGFLIVGCSSYRVPVTSPQISTDKLIYYQGEEITVSFSGSSGHRRDWISLSPVGSPDNEAGIFQYIYGGLTKGEMLFTAPSPGMYEARGYFDYSERGHHVYARSRFKVVPKEVTTLQEKALPPEIDKLAKTYKNILCRKFTATRDIQQGYSEQIQDMQSSMIESLKSKFENVYFGAPNLEIDGDTLVLEAAVSGIHIAGFWRRGVDPVNRSWIEVDLTFYDGKTKTALGRKHVTTENSSVGAFLSFGFTDRSLPSDMGKILAESIGAAIQNKHSSIRYGSGSGLHS